ncbi:MAG: hypothetical protein GC145_08960 [Caulobacter sp.]|nr:hypothetical protein [Caulobacter sp.]
MLFDTDPADLDPEDFGYAHPDEEEAAADKARGYASRIILIATLFLAVTNAASLVSWSSTLNPDWGGRTMRVLSQGWAGQMSELHLDLFRNQVRDLWAAFAALPRKPDPESSPDPGLAAPPAE